MRSRRHIYYLATTLAAVAAGVAAGSTAARTPGASAASCAAQTRAQEFRAARVVFVGVMLSGPSTPKDGRGELLSPARVRVTRYLKSHGPSTVRVQTGISRTDDGSYVGNSEGIYPRAGQHWKIYSRSTHRPYATSVCDGSRQVAAHHGRSHDARVVGKVLFCGGPPPGRCFVPHQKGTVTAYDSHHHRVAQVDGSRGRFSFRLLPGHYAITARYPNATRGSRHVYAAAGKTLRIRIRCPIK
ncbi:MAG: hypothetical protein ACJ764_14030 [Solirubrobacteraceae bacterium]